MLTTIINLIKKKHFLDTLPKSVIGHPIHSFGGGQYREYVNGKWRYIHSEEPKVIYNKTLMGKVNEK